MNHVLLAVGKPSARYAALGLEHFAKRMKAHGGLALDSVKPARAAKNTPPAQVMAEEGQRLLARLQPRDCVWALDRQGRALTSEQWAEALERARMNGHPRLVLVVGGPLGLDQAMLDRADLALSLGPPTLAHELAALAAAEQIYRAHAILAGSPYHK